MYCYVSQILQICKYNNRMNHRMNLRWQENDYLLKYDTNQCRIPIIRHKWIKYFKPHLKEIILQTFLSN